MKSFSAWGLLLLSLSFNAWLWRRVARLEEIRAVATEPADYPLGEEMGYLQRYADKLWFAGRQGDWELAKFYQDEINETTENVVRAKVAKDGVEVSRLLGAELPPAIEGLGKAVEARDPVRFEASYRAMVESCNACHAAAGHSFIRVAVPSGPPTHWNQEFRGSNGGD